MNDLLFKQFAARLKRAATPELVFVYRGYQRLRHGSLTIGAAAVLTNSSNELLMVRVSYRTGWGIPGGFRRRREDPADTIAREVVEETGLVPVFGSLTPAIHFEPHQSHLTLVYVGSAEGMPRVPTGFIGRHEVIEVAWRSHQNLSGLQRGTRALLRAAGYGDTDPNVELDV